MIHTSRSIVLRKVDGVFGALWRGKTSRTYGGTAPSFAIGGFGMAILTLIIVAITAVLSHLPDVAAYAAAFDAQQVGFAGMALAGITAAPISQKRADLAKLYKELGDGQKEIAAGTVTEARGAELEAKAQEAETLQKEIDNYDRIERLATKGREIAETHLPAGENGTKGVDDGDKVVGYAKPGQLFANSEQFADFVQKQGAPAGQVSRPMLIKSFHEGLIPISRKMLESKAIPTLGADVLVPDRIAEIVRTTEPQRLRVRDVLDVSGTSGSSVEYLTLVAGVEAATPVAANAAKPEGTMELGTATAPVRTLAVWVPVTEQMLSDLPAIQGIVDNELTYDLKRLEERQIMYGSGAGENLQGILTLGGVPSITRTVTNTTNIDRIRIGATDIMVAGGEPNAVTIHPVDWEGIVLAKGTDNRYVWVLVTDPVSGNSRIWGLQTVETVAMKNPANLQRHLLVGDFKRGATLWDRQQASVQVGWVNDDFTKNRRTIRGEERVAFGVKRPTFFAKYETATAA